MADEVKLYIDYIKDKADGVAKYKNQLVYVPFTCSGETVKAQIVAKEKEHYRAKLIEVITPSENRTNPVCKHFTHCGGCDLQHLNDEAYYQFKQGILDKIIQYLAVDPAVVLPIVKIGQKKRRRLEYQIKLEQNNVKIGFFSANSYDVVDINQCPVTSDRLVNILPLLKDCLKNLKNLRKIKSIGFSIADNGLDATIQCTEDIKDDDKAVLISFAKQNDITRFSYVVDSSKKNYVTFFGSDIYTTLTDIKIKLPAGSFMQATYEGQQAITEFIINNSTDCKKIADLYSGCGTYSFPLAVLKKTIYAYEGDQDMIMSMHNAAVNNSLESYLVANNRDLFKNPLQESELIPFDMVIINPPRAGAYPQVKKIVNARVNKVIMVSCNPSTFTRDAKYFIDYGYKMTKAVAIDQFYYSSHLELVALFTI
jgi:23S rRNA (uracil1939-C5)-methyltransferase